MADGLREGVHAADADGEVVGLQGRGEHQIFRWGGYRKNLTELLEATPLGIIGRANPEYLEWFMGFPIGWTELSA